MRVLLVRLDGIGDAAVCTPLVAALREAGHEVGVALTTRNAGLFAPHAIVAEHVLERIPWPAHGSTPESRARARTEIVASRYDVALIASEEPEAFELAAQVPERVGFTTGWSRPLKTLWARARTTRTVSRSQRIGAEDAHEVEVLYRLGAGLVAAPRPPVDRDQLRDQLVTRAVPYVLVAAAPLVLQAGPKWRATGVSDATLRTIVERLVPYGLTVLAAPGDAAQVREVTGVEPRTFARLSDWIDTIALAPLIVTVDTGAAHVAGMLGTAVADVFPDAHFEAQVRRWRPWASPYRAFRASEIGGAGTALIEAVLDGF